jgi:hypothetical protein
METSINKSIFMANQPFHLFAQVKSMAELAEQLEVNENQLLCVELEDKGYAVRDDFLVDEMESKACECKTRYTNLEKLGNNKRRRIVIGRRKKTAAVVVIVVAVILLLRRQSDLLPVAHRRHCLNC